MNVTLSSHNTLKLSSASANSLAHLSKKDTTPEDIQKLAQKGQEVVESLSTSAAKQTVAETYIKECEDKQVKREAVVADLKVKLDEVIADADALRDGK